MYMLAYINMHVFDVHVILHVNLLQRKPKIMQATVHVLVNKIYENLKAPIFFSWLLFKCT